MNTNESVKSLQEYVNVPLAELVESTTNPRKTFDEKGLQETRRKHPQQKVCSCRSLCGPSTDHYEIVTGERPLPGLEAGRAWQRPRDCPGTQRRRVS